MAEGLLEDLIGVHDLVPSGASAVPRRNRVRLVGNVEVTDDATLRETVITFRSERLWRGVSSPVSFELPNYDRDVYRFSGSAGITVQGLVAPSETGRTLVTIVNATGGLLSLAHEHATPAAGNRFHCPGGVAATLADREARFVLYDFTTSRWRVI